MITLSLDTAHKYILQVLDEFKNTDGVPMLAEVDNLDTRKMAEAFLIEAMVKAHKDAPSYLIDGKEGKEKPRTWEEGKEPDNKDYDYSVTIEGTTAKIVMLQKSARLASIKASDSPVVVVDYAPEESPIGRMQNDKYVRGTYDDPRLIVKKNWAEERKPEYLYYSVKDNTATFALEYVPYPTSTSSMQISDKLEYAVLNLLASMVLDALSLSDKAAIYKNKYVEYLQTTR